MSVIINTSVFSNFAAVKRLDLLRLVFGQLYLSEQVFEEIQTGLLQGYTFYDNLAEQIFPFSETGWLHLTALNSTEEFKLFGQLLLNLRHRCQSAIQTDNCPNKRNKFRIPNLATSNPHHHTL